MKINPVEAKKNLDSEKTVSGADLGEQYFAWDDLYQGTFYRKLISLGYDSGLMFLKLFERMNAYEFSGEFVDKPASQLQDISMFGLILFDRIVRAEAEKMSFEDVFDLHEDLSLCLDYVMDAQKTSDRARRNVLLKLRADPKQADKAIVRECWNTWRQNPDDYKGKADFARDMREQFPKLKSQQVIEGWCRAWEREPKPLVS